jgi:hypothetical protein
MIAFSAAWSAAVAKFSRPFLRVTTAISVVTMASPTSTAVLAASVASAA